MADSAAQAAAAQAAADVAMDQMISDYGIAGATGGPLVPVGRESEPEPEQDCDEDPQWFQTGKGKGKGKDNPMAWYQDDIPMEVADLLRRYCVLTDTLHVYNQYIASAVADRDRRCVRSLRALGARPKYGAPSRPRPSFQSTDSYFAEPSL